MCIWHDAVAPVRRNVAILSCSDSHPASASRAAVTTTNGRIAKNLTRSCLRQRCGQLRRTRRGACGTTAATHDGNGGCRGLSEATPGRRGRRVSDAGPSQRWEQSGDGAAGFSAPTGGNSAGTLGWRGRETPKRAVFPEVHALSGWRISCSHGWRASRVSRSSLFDRADAGSWAKRQPAVQGLLFRHDVRRVPASGLHDVRKRERPRQLQNRRRWSGRVCSRRRAAHRCCSGRAEHPRRCSVPVGPFAY